MPEITEFEKLLSSIAKKRFGIFRWYGMAQYGFSHYGDDSIYIIVDKGPPIKYFSDTDGNPIDFAGIYRTDNVTGKVKNYREPYYITRNPRYPNQQAHRKKYGEAVEAWWGLTDEEKMAYNQRAKGKGYSGWNLFYKEYLLSQ